MTQEGDTFRQQIEHEEFEEDSYPTPIPQPERPSQESPFKDQINELKTKYAKFANMKERHKLRKTESKSSGPYKSGYDFSRIVNSGNQYGSSKITGYAQASDVLSSTILSPRSPLPFIGLNSQNEIVNSVDLPQSSPDLANIYSHRTNLYCATRQC